MVEHLGADQLLHGRFDGGGDLITVRTSSEQNFDTGQAVAVSLISEKMHLFDAASGKRLG